MALAEIIAEKIKQEGPISFRDFMQMALYYPRWGYYTSMPETVGKSGDFYTSAYITPLFGAMIGRQLEEMWNILGTKEFTVVEFGAGTGMLCRDILEYLKGNAELYDRLSYVIIEKSPIMREKEKRHLHEKVIWADSVRDVEGITGCILSNELVDNFSVHQVVMKEELMEVLVDYADGFVELLRPAPSGLRDYLSTLNVRLPIGYRTEINLDAIIWMEEIAAALSQGYVITIDYGYPSAQLYEDKRRLGTLVCYHKHTINEDPYHHVGEQDITTHVNFSALSHWGKLFGLDCCGFTNQGNFLKALDFEQFLNRKVEDGMSGEQAAFIKRNLLSDMGTKFKVLIQQKGKYVQKLSGLHTCIPLD